MSDLMKRDYLDYLQDIIDSINDIESFVGGMNFNSFEKDKKTMNAVVRSLEIIGEAVKKIPEDVKDKYSDIPWKNMSGMRDKLIHEYFGIDEEIVWNVAIEELPPLGSLFKKILTESGTEE
ncbi:MAG: DUF86 domain-containing protein [Parcubacteria group bacterium]|nr:DUF86 domain-containing protein [Parcubacteria group bacterium]MCR4342316.1 DUF86 domain-containing protein [Patescibacteria group bacterium]